VGYDGEFHGGYMELIIHFNRNFHSKPTNHFWVPPFLRNPFMYIYICCIYIYVNTNHLIIWVHKTSSSSTSRPGSHQARLAIEIHHKDFQFTGFSLLALRPGNQTRRWTRWVLRDWWFQGIGGFNLPLVGNILLILMVNINGYYMDTDG
jgi:hypothetical protein